MNSLLQLYQICYSVYAITLIKVGYYCFPAFVFLLLFSYYYFLAILFSCYYFLPSVFLLLFSCYCLCSSL